MKLSNKARRYMSNLQDEVNSVALYGALAEVEREQGLAEIYRRMADEEETHVRAWEQKLSEMNVPVPRRRTGWQTRIVIWLAKRFGAGVVLPTMSLMERDVLSRVQDGTERQVRRVHAQKQSHAQLLRAIERSSQQGIEGGAIARLEGRHHAIGGNVLRASVLGANDGLISNLSLIMGVMGAEFSGQTIVITGFAGLLAGAGSMAIGEWISVRSSWERDQRQIEIESDEIEEMPEEEKEEMVLFFEAKGLEKKDAEELAEDLMSDHDVALKTHCREELGIDPTQSQYSPWKAAGTSFLLFAIGAAVPLLPFLILQDTLALVGSVLLSAMTLFLFGGAVTLLTGRRFIHSGIRQLLLGLGAAILTFGIGRSIGVTLAG